MLHALCLAAAFLFFEEEKSSTIRLYLEAVESARAASIDRAKQRASDAERELERAQREVEDAMLEIKQIETDFIPRAEKMLKAATRNHSRQRSKKARDRTKPEVDRAASNLEMAKKDLDAARSRLGRANDALAIAKAKLDRQQHRPPKHDEATDKPDALPYRGLPFHGIYTGRDLGQPRRTPETLFKIGEVIHFDIVVTRLSKPREGYAAIKPDGFYAANNLSVLQVFSADSCLVSRMTVHIGNITVDPHVFLVRGIDTKEIRERNLDSFCCHDVFVVSGTHRYENVAGKLSTVFVLDRVDPEEFSRASR